MGSPDLFERVGGFEGASRLALALYDRVMESERLESFFARVNMQRLVEHQALFLSSVMGGPASYSDDELKAIHAPLGIDRRAFHEMLGEFRRVLEAHHLTDEDVQTVMTELAARERCIVSRGGTRGSRVA